MMLAHEIWSNNEILSQILYNLKIKEVAKISRVSKDFHNSDPAQAINKDDNDLHSLQNNWIDNDTNKNILTNKRKNLRCILSQIIGIDLIAFSSTDAILMGWSNKKISKVFLKK